MQGSTHHQQTNHRMRIDTIGMTASPMEEQTENLNQSLFARLSSDLQLFIMSWLRDPADILRLTRTNRHFHTMRTTNPSFWPRIAQSKGVIRRTDDFYTHPWPTQAPLEIFILWVKRKCGHGRPGKRINALLRHALHTDRIELVRAICKESGDSWEGSAKEWVRHIQTPAMLAVMEQCFPGLESLNSGTLLAEFILARNQECVDFLLDTRQVRINHISTMDMTPLMAAGIVGDAGLFFDLLNRGANPNLENYVPGTTMMAIAQGGNVDILKGLWNHSRFGHDPLDKHPHTIKKTVAAREANINYAPKGETPLDCAIRHGHTDMAKLLIRYGASSEYALVCACSYGRYEITEYLVDSLGMDIDQKLKLTLRLSSHDSRWITPLNAAAENGHTEIIRFLLKQGVRMPSAGAHQGHSEIAWHPLLLACRKGYLSVVKTLVTEGGADVNVVSPIRTSPLTEAVRGSGEWTRDYLALVEFLVENGADLSFRNYDHRTPLQVAQETHRIHGENGQPEIILRYLEATIAGRAKSPKRKRESNTLLSEKGHRDQGIQRVDLIKKRG